MATTRLLHSGAACAPSCPLERTKVGPRWQTPHQMLPAFRIAQAHSARFFAEASSSCTGGEEATSAGVRHGSRSRGLQQGLPEPKVKLQGGSAGSVESEASQSEQTHAIPMSRRAALFGAVSAAAAFTTTSQSTFAATSVADLSLNEMKLEIRKVVSLAKAPGVLRLVFHDAFTYDPATQSGGPNGSVIYELDRPENDGLKRVVRPLEKLKASLGDRVSWADLIAVAGAEAVAMTGGPVIPVRLGRLDQRAADPFNQMPPETLDAVALKASFRARNYSTQEMIALSGAHTLGGKGFGDPTTFDNSYYTILLDKPWETDTPMTKMIGLQTDRAYPDDDECRRWVLTYAVDQDKFFKDFASAYDKMVTQGARWRS